MTPQDADWSKTGGDDGGVTVKVHAGPPTSEARCKLDIGAAPAAYVVNDLVRLVGGVT